MDSDSIPGEARACLRILVVEDDMVVSGLMKKVLQRAGHQVVTVDTGRKALALLASEVPDLVVLDLDLPDTTGLDVCRSIRLDPLLGSLPVIMVTGHQLLEDKVKGFSEGVDDYITKPFRVQEFLARLHAVVHRARRWPDSNPLTLLPGRGAAERDILRRSRIAERFAVLYAEMHPMDAFNARHGFGRGDELIRDAARLFLSAVPSKTDFLAHLGGPLFLIVTVAVDAPLLCQRLVERFDAWTDGHPAFSGGGLRLAIGGAVLSGSAPPAPLGVFASLGAQTRAQARQENRSAFRLASV